MVTGRENPGSVAIGAMIQRAIPPEHVVGVASAFAPYVDELWVVEDLPFAGGISQASAVLAATADLPSPPVVGHGIAPAPFRNPAALAMEWATLGRMYPGRFHGGLGHGVPDWMTQIGSKKASPLALLAETITATRRLLNGETVSADGRYVHLDSVTLEFPPDPVPLVSAGVAGPKSLAVAGRVADGTILSEGTGPEKIKDALRNIDAGRAVARADPDLALSDHHRLTVFTNYFCGPTVSLQTPSLPEGWGAVGTTAEQVAALLQSLIDAGADAVILVPIGEHASQQIELAATEIVPQLAR